MNNPRRTAYRLLLDEEETGKTRRAVDAFLAATIVVSVAAMIVGTLDGVQDAYGGALFAIEAFCVTVFLIEYVLRVWSVVEDRSGHFARPVAGRVRYALTPMALIDLAAIVPFFLEILLAPQQFVFLRSLRTLRLLKLTRYSSALNMLELVLVNQRRQLIAALFGSSLVWVLAASLVWSLEHEAQPEAFGSIPASMWWAIVTMTTVGYGDVYPITTPGRLVAGVVSMLGIAMFALPTAILGAGYLQEQGKRDFSRSIGLVGRVSLFRKLTPGQLVEVANLLHPRRVPRGYVLIRKGDVPRSMFFVVEGRLSRHGSNRDEVIGPDSFFGEAALMEGERQNATVTAATSCTLLELQAADLQVLLERHDELREALGGRPVPA